LYIKKKDKEQKLRSTTFHLLKYCITSFNCKQFQYSPLSIKRHHDHHIIIFVPMNLKIALVYPLSFWLF